MNFLAFEHLGKASAGLEHRSEGILVWVRSIRQNQLVIEVRNSSVPSVVLRKGFEKSIVGKDIWKREKVIEDKNRMAEVAMGGRNADELDSNDIRIDGGNWGSNDLSLDFEKLTH